MKPSLWLHCGAYKSGTSRIQNLAWSRREELRDRGWLYPQTGLSTHEPDVGQRHSRLVYAFFEDRAEWLRIVDDLVAEIQDSDADRVLLSAEAWSRPRSADQALAALLDRLREADCVDDVHIVLYIRNRFSYARSFYRELTRRRGNQLTLAEFVDAKSRALDALDTIRTLRDLVDPGRLHAFSYEASGDTGAHLFGLLDLPLLSEEPWTNLGLGAAEVEAHRQLNMLPVVGAERFPGLRNILPAEVRIDDEEYDEQFADGQLESPPEWRAEFQRITGWADEQIAALVRRPDAAPGDVTRLGPVIRGVVEAWIESTCVPLIDITTHQHPSVDEVQLHSIDERAVQFRLGGCVLPRRDAGRLRLLTIDDDGEHAAKQGRPSPGFARQFPDRPEAAEARFVVPRSTFGRSGRIDLLNEQPSGERNLLASIRRRWELP